MKRTRYVFAIAVVTGIVLMIGSTSAFAYRCMMSKEQGFHGKKMGDPVTIVMAHQEMLGLSDAQIDDLSAVHEKTAKQLAAQRDIIEKVRQELAAERAKDTLNKKAMYRLINRKYKAKTIKARANVDAEIAMRKILTAEQWEQAKELLAADSGSMKKNMGKCGGMSCGSGMGMMSKGKGCPYMKGDSGAMTETEEAVPADDSEEAAQ